MGSREGRLGSTGQRWRTTRGSLRLFVRPVPIPGRLPAQITGFHGAGT